MFILKVGHLVNPYLFRLNYAVFWAGSLIVSSKFDAYINVFSVYFFNFVKNYFKNYNWVDKNFLFVNSLKFFFTNKKIFIFIDFSKHAKFDIKRKIDIQNQCYFFPLALSKIRIKSSKKLNSRHIFNYFELKKKRYFKKKIFFKFFVKNFLNKKTKFLINTRPVKMVYKNSWLDHFYDTSRRLRSFIHDKKTSKFNINSAASRLAVLEYGVRKPHFYLVRNCFDYKEFTEKYSGIRTLDDFKLFLKYQKVSKVSLKDEFLYWSNFLDFKKKIEAKKELLHFLKLCFILLSLYYYNKEQEEKEYLKKRFKRILRYYLYLEWAESADKRKALKRKFFIKKKKSIKFNFSISKLNLLKKKKLKNYIYWSKKSSIKFLKFFRNRLMYDRSKFTFLKTIRKRNAIKFKKQRKKKWWLKFVYLLYNKRKLTGLGVKKSAQIFRRKKPYFSFFKFKRLSFVSIKKKFYYKWALNRRRKFFKEKAFTFQRKFYYKKILNIRKKIFIHLKKKVKVRRLFVKFFRFYRKKRFKYFKKKKHKRDHPMLLKFKKYFSKKKHVIKKKYFVKKKHVKKIRFKSKKKNYKYFMDRSNNKFVFLRKSVEIKRNTRLFYYFNKFVFMKKKLKKKYKFFKKFRLKKKRPILKKPTIQKKPINSKKLKLLKKLEALKKKKLAEEKKKADLIAKLEEQRRRESLTILDNLGKGIAIDNEYLKAYFFVNNLKFFIKRKGITPKKPIVFYKKFFLLLKHFYFYSKFYLIKKNFSRYVYTVLSYFNKISVSFYIRFYQTFEVTADLVAEFLILFFLKKKYILKEILGTILNYLNKAYLNKNIGGYAILMKGRFTRKDRAMYSWKKAGPMPLSHRVATVDYSNRWVPLKYSQCSFKIYIFRDDANYLRKNNW